MPEKPLDIILDDTLRVGGSQVLDNDENIAIGIALPITKGNAGYFQQEYLTIHQLKHNIKNLILTMKGERPMLPTFGTEIYSILSVLQPGPTLPPPITPLDPSSTLPAPNFVASKSP